MSKSTIAYQTATDVQEQFGLRLRERLQDLEEQDLLAHLHEYLSARVLEMMNSNFEQLMATLYRIDVSEAAVKKVFKQTDETAIAGQLATLIIDRQRLKAETRAAYREGSEGIEAASP